MLGLGIDRIADKIEFGIGLRISARGIAAPGAYGPCFAII